MKTEKVAAVESLREELKSARLVIFTGFSGVAVPEITEFRKRVRKEQGKFRVVKNTFLNRSLDVLGEDGKKESGGFLAGPTGIIFFSGKDEIPLLKSVFAFAKEKAPKMVFRGGYQDGISVSPAQLAYLANLPGREAVTGQFCATLAAPLYHLLFVLKAVPQKFAVVLKQISEKSPKP